MVIMHPMKKHFTFFNGILLLKVNEMNIFPFNSFRLGLSNPHRNFVRVKDETVAFDTRKWRILEQILIRQPDLCALEEADIYDCFLQHHLPKYG